MSRKGHGQIRRGQIITTYGPGALIDLLRDESPASAGIDEVDAAPPNRTRS